MIYFSLLNIHIIIIYIYIYTALLMHDFSKRAVYEGIRRPSGVVIPLGNPSDQIIFQILKPRFSRLNAKLMVPIRLVIQVFEGINTGELLRRCNHLSFCSPNRIVQATRSNLCRFCRAGVQFGYDSGRQRHLFRTF